MYINRRVHGFAAVFGHFCHYLNIFNFTLDCVQSLLIVINAVLSCKYWYKFVFVLCPVCICFHFLVLFLLWLFNFSVLQLLVKTHSNSYQTLTYFNTVITRFIGLALCARSLHSPLHFALYYSYMEAQICLRNLISFTVCCIPAVNYLALS